MRENRSLEIKAWFHRAPSEKTDWVNGREKKLACFSASRKKIPFLLKNFEKKLLRFPLPWKNKQLFHFLSAFTRSAFLKGMRWNRSLARQERFPRIIYFPSLSSAP